MRKSRFWLAGTAGTSPPRDSPQILIAGALLVNFTWGVVALVRRRWRKGATG
jgi:hypothetical protein